MPQSPPSQTHYPEDPQIQSINGEGEENNNRARHSPGGRESNEQKCYGGISPNWQSGNPLLSQCDNELTSLVLDSKRIHGTYNFVIMCSSSRGQAFPFCESLDQTLEVPDRISCQTDLYALDSSEPGIVLLPDRSGIGYTSWDASLRTSIVISRRDLSPLLEAISRSICGGSSQASHLVQSNITVHIGCNISSSGIQSSSIFSWFFHCHFLDAQTPRGLSNVIQRSILPTLGHTFWCESRPPTSTSSEEGLDNEADQRQQYVQTVSFIYLWANGILDGSLSLRLTTVDSRRQDNLFLGQSPVFNTVDLHDSHHDMRLDVDNMTYEELLDLEDRIGNVNTGLSEEVVGKFLKNRKYLLFSEENALKEFCSICQEEYMEEDELGTLECGHDFHVDCITQWLRYKNLCPVCKCTGLSNFPSNS